MYTELFDKWTEISAMADVDFSKEQVDCSQILIARLQKCDQHNFHEGILSGVVCCTLQDLFRLFEAADRGDHPLAYHIRHLFLVQGQQTRLP